MDQSPHSDPDYAFGWAMLSLRSTLGLTQAAEAELLSVSRRAVVNWESGTRYPIAAHLKKLIALAVQQGAFPVGHEEEEIRSLWQASHQKVLLDEAWMASLLSTEYQYQVPSSRWSPENSAPGTGHSVLGTSRAGVPHLDWGDALSVSTFHGRSWELDLLAQWTVEESCRVVSVLGLGGIGKSALAVALMRQVASQFDVVIWRSLRDAPTVDALLDDCLQVARLEAPGAMPGGYPVAEDGAGALPTELRLNALVEYMRRARILLVLDNLETVLEEGASTGGYPQGAMRERYEGFSRLLHLVAETEHQSCLLFTSREKPAELVPFEGNRSPVRALRLPGLEAEACDALLTEKEVKGSAPERARLINTYAANPLALKIVAQTIVDLFGGEPAPFLEQGGVIFGGVRDLLAEQFDRLSPLEQSMMIWLAILREPASLETLRAVPATPVSLGELLEGVEALHRRSLVERSNQPGRFTLQPVVLEYVISRLITDVCREIEQGRPDRMIGYGFVQAQAPDYVRQTQERLIGQPILQRLVATSGAGGAETRLLNLLEGWRGRPHAEQGYGPGNVANLLRLLRGDLRGLDLSHLFIRQVYLQEADAQDVSLAGSHLSECALADAFDFCLPVSFSPDGRRLAAGTHSGEVCVWQLADRVRIVSTPGHKGALYGVEWTSDGSLLASCGVDGTVKLWEPQTGRLLTTFEGHTGVVRQVCFSKDGQFIASGSLDATVKLWETSTGRLLHKLQGHEAGVWDIDLSNDGSMVASASADGTVKLWDISTGSLLTTLEGHSGIVYAVAFTPDGQLVASGGQDGLIRLWEVATGHLAATMKGHTQLIWHIAVSTDGQLMVSGSNDGTVRLWDIPQSLPLRGWNPMIPGDVCLATLKGHTGAVLDVAISPDARLIASTSQDGTLRLWEAPSGKPVTTLQGYARGAWALAWEGSGKLLANGTQDGTVNLWDVPAGTLRVRLHGHTGMVFGTALSEDGELLATGSFDYTIRFWRIADGLCLRTLQAHEGSVVGLVLSPDARLLISGGADGWIKLWDVSQSVPGGEALATIQAHSGVIWHIALSGDGHLLATASQDGTVKLWEIPSGKLLATMRDRDDLFWGVAVNGDGTLVASGGNSGRVTLWEAPSGRFLGTLGAHEGQAWGIALSRDERLLVSGGVDGAVMLWDVATRRLISRLTGHDGPVNDVAVSPDGSLIASSGQDGAVMLWDPASGACRATLRPDRRYERMAITGIKGLTEAQKETLRALGAVGG